MPIGKDSMFYVIWIRNALTRFQVPDEFKNKPKYVASLQINCTLCDPCVGLFGRTAVILSEEPPKAIQEINIDAYLMFYSDYKVDNTAVICDIVVNIHDSEQNNKVIK